MIQRIQSLFFFFSAICLIAIVYVFPILQDENISYLLYEHFPIVRLVVFFSSALSIFAIFQFKNRNRQKFIATLARFLITIALILIVFVYREDKAIGIGLLLLIIPFLSLIAANLFIKKDEKLVESADRIR
jgi:peptidoglycan/LPS O-acetylase OafA/YrhL